MSLTVTWLREQFPWRLDEKVGPVMAGVISVNGNLAADPELETVRVNGEEREVCRLRVGYTINRGRQDANYIDVTTWGDAAVNHAKFLSKGSPLHVSGELSHDRWDSDGEQRSKHSIINAEVEYLGSSSEGSAPPPAKTGRNGGRNSKAGASRR